ncbi:hypothetical protein [Hahella ganghwensis]|uniref:hypothetical protein n=1 Tax=Hahella ganghwensis TaxID=286420 RepID=UPI000372EEFA|nr:hypothetical protein [Hahella ganghwensis]
MNKPTWVTVIGILMIIFGGLGILGAAQEIAMPVMMDMHKEMMTAFGQGEDGAGVPKISWEIEQDGEKQTLDMSQFYDAMQEQLQFPDWYKSWGMLMGLVSMAIGALYLLSGIFLLMTKSFAVNTIYLALGLSILWAIIQGVLFLGTDSGLLLAQVPAFLASIVIDIILLIVVLTGSKDVFKAEKVDKSLET